MSETRWLIRSVLLVVLVGCGSSGSSGGSSGAGGGGGGDASSSGGQGGQSGAAGSAGAAGAPLVPIDAPPTGLVKFDTKMIVTHYFTDMQAYDLSDPLKAVLVDDDFSTFGSSSRGAAEKISDQFFVVGVESGGIAIFNSNGGREQLVDGRRPGQNYNVNQFQLVSGTVLFASIASQGTASEFVGEVAVYDVSMPKTAAYLTSFKNPTGAEIGSHGIQIDATRQLAFVFDGSFLRAFDVANPQQPKEVGNRAHFVSLGGTYSQTLVQRLRGTTLFALQGPSSPQHVSLYAFDVADVTNITEVTDTDIPDCELRGLELLKADHLLVRCRNDMRVFSAADPANPQQITSVSLETGVSLQVTDTVYLGAIHGGFHGVDVADPTAPKVLFSP